ncbi:DMT family transporter [Ramlibacter sp. XY19]|uniref:DMT family transporter n=1 Tax=Ramlibacter paludis TaxID=2908000 RepID=UPI0023D9A097|nr:DMT family transporter [Ramlibacter paludis]MCG2592653.1 DMT family transporter [Ramlibacter paludis]
MHSNSDGTLRAANRRGVLAMAAGMASFVANDTLVKYVSQSLPASQLIFLRGVFAIALLLVVVHAMGATRQIPRLLDARVLLRALFDAVATLCYLIALFQLPLANATAINMATPLFLTLFAIVAFGEKVGAARWLAIAAGFAGVLLVVQPSGDAFNAYALLCVAGTLLQAARDLVTRTIHRGIPSIVVTLSTAIGVTVLSGAWSLVQDWQPASGRQLALLAVASVFLSGGYYLVTIAMRAGEMSVIAPFRYAGLLFAVVLGYAVWGDVPNALAWSGIALLVAAGVAVLRLSSRR